MSLASGGTISQSWVLLYLTQRVFIVTEYNLPVGEATDPKPPTRRSSVPTTGPIFERLDFVAGIVAAVMILGPLRHGCVLGAVSLDERG
jgi:hypothetical protein